MKTVFLFALSILSLHAVAQKKKKKVPVVVPLAKPIPNPDSVFSKFTIESNQLANYRSLVNDSIQKSISLPISDAVSEQKWAAAFAAMESIQYKSPWINNRLQEAAASLSNKSIDFQQSFLELMYSMYPFEFTVAVKNTMEQTAEARIFMLCAEYLLKDSNNVKTKEYIQNIYDSRKRSEAFAITSQPLMDKLKAAPQKMPALKTLLRASFYNAVTIVYSIQRKNRNYPGLVIVRQPNGKFYRNADNSIYTIPQLARSTTNLPYYFANGNPPQGIYKIISIDTFYNDVYTGPTASIELAMPFQIKVSAFSPLIKDPNFPWHIAYYRPLLPVDWQTYTPIFESYNTGQVQHQKVIATGSAINPDNFKTKPFYPLTPYRFGLTTKEQWSKTDGRRISSDQLSLVNVLKKIAGPYAYYVIVEISDDAAPVSLEELKASILFAESN
jgi:hypothetical protein